MNEKNTGLYIHIPFCERKCPYCDFYSVVTSDSLQESYVESVLSTIDRYKSENEGLSFDSIYFGGGTPSILNLSLMQKIMQRLMPMATEDCEISMEANPCTVDREKLFALKRFGINRLSFGMQSANDTERKTLGRRHDNTEVANAVLFAKEAGFDNISIDIMLGTPHQSIDSIDETLAFVEGLGVTHVSAYMLKIEPQTAFNNEKIISLIPDDDTVSDIYLKVCARLSQIGFSQYEISNFSRAGFESRHNLKYWLLEDYIGIGPAAHSFFKGERFFYPRDISEFIEQGGQNKILDQVEESGSELYDYIMLGLRLTSGIDLDVLSKKYRLDSTEFEKKAKKYIAHKLMQQDGRRLFLTPAGFLLSNSIILDFLELL